MKLSRIRQVAAISTLGLILVILLVLWLCGGFVGSMGAGAHFGPVGLILVILLILFLTGNL